MGMTLQDAINLASDPANRFGVNTFVMITMHDENSSVLVGHTENTATFRSDLPLQNWGTGTISQPGSIRNSWFNRAVPGFSTRGQGGLQMEVAPASFSPLLTPIPVDVSVRRDPGPRALAFLGLAPSVQIEIETLTSLGGTAVGGVTLQATEDGPLLRAVGRSLRDPGYRASYTVTLDVVPVIP